MANYMSDCSLINKFQTYDLSPVRIIGIKVNEEHIKDVIFEIEDYFEPVLDITRDIRHTQNNIRRYMTFSQIKFQYYEDGGMCRDADVIKNYLSQLAKAYCNAT